MEKQAGPNPYDGQFPQIEELRNEPRRPMTGLPNEDAGQCKEGLVDRDWDDVGGGLGGNDGDLDDGIGVPFKTPHGLN